MLLPLVKTPWCQMCQLEPSLPSLLPFTLPLPDRTDRQTGGTGRKRESDIGLRPPYLSRLAEYQHLSMHLEHFSRRKAKTETAFRHKSRQLHNKGPLSSVSLGTVCRAKVMGFHGGQVDSTDPGRGRRALSAGKVCEQKNERGFDERPR